MPTDKSGKYSRINPADHTNHNPRADKGETSKKDFKATPTVVIGKPNPDANVPNKPRSANTEKNPVTPKGKPTLPDKVTEGSGSKSTAGDPSFSPQDSANKGGPMKLNMPKDMGKK